MNGIAVRAYGVVLLAGMPLLAVALLVWNGSLGVGLEPPPGAPGMLTGIGIPTSQALRDLSAAVTIGALVLTATVLPPASRREAALVTGSRRRLLGLAAVAGSVWVWTGLANLVLSYAETAGVDPTATGGLAHLGSFVTDVDLGRALLATSAIAAVSALGSMLARRTTTVGLLAVVSLAALWPLATTAHGNGGLNHDVAVNAQFAHVLGVALWAGGLAALLMIYRHLPAAAVPAVVSRYSAIAGWAFALVAVSGVTAATLRLNRLADLTSDYGVLVVAKATALLVLGVLGWVHRRRLLSRLAEQPASARAFRRIAGAELGLMGVAFALAVALSRTEPPPGATAISASEALLGYPMPAPLGASQWLTQWRIDTFWFPVAVVGVGLYLAGVRRLRRRGDRWPLGRTVSWLIAGGLLIWATSGAPGAYGRVLFSMHMVQHMTIASAVPIFLTLGGPITLALRALPVRYDGSRGPREWLLLLVHSRLLRAVGNPVVAAALFIVSLVVFYSSPLFELSLRSHTMHVFMVAHFLLTGYLFASAICGIDPGPARLPHPFRALLLMITFGFHALFFVSLMAKGDLIAADWFGALGRNLGVSLSDQQAGAQLGWILGDYPVAILGGALIWSWVRADLRTAARYERQAQRDGGEEHRSYNEYLERLARRHAEAAER